MSVFHYIISSVNLINTLIKLGLPSMSKFILNTVFAPLQAALNFWPPPKKQILWVSYVVIFGLKNLFWLISTACSCDSSAPFSIFPDTIKDLKDLLIGNWKELTSNLLGWHRKEERLCKIQWILMKPKRPIDWEMERIQIKSSRVT